MVTVGPGRSTPAGGQASWKARTWEDVPCAKATATASEVRLPFIDKRRLHPSIA